MAVAKASMFAQVTWLALDNLRANKVRSFLTMLGIVIGILSVIVIAAIVSGLNGSFEQQVANLGTNTVSVTRLPQFANRRLTAEERMRKDITREHLEVIREQAKHLGKASGVMVSPGGNTLLKYQNKQANGTFIIGTEADYIDIANSTMRSGRYITHMDDDHHAKVIVIGSTVADNMFPNEDPVGKMMQFEKDEFEVIGVMEKRGSFLGFDRDNFAFVPLSTMMKLHSELHANFQISMSAKSGPEVPQLIDEATEIMRRERHDAYNKPDSFYVGTQNQLLDFYKTLTSGLYATMVTISSIALMVGGIGVMNIMLVSVTERTREIGVRKAIGARTSDILQQFILEAVVLCAVAGTIAIVIGIGFAALLDKFSPLPAKVPFSLMLIAFGVSASIGLFFGIYPAARAAKLDPIEALRYE